MARGTSSSSTPATTAAAAAPSADFPVFVDTSLGTHLAMIVTALDTVADFKRKIMDEHPLCFPDFGEIMIHAMKVRRRSFFYHLSDAMLVRSAFLGSKKAWFVHVDASSACLVNNELKPIEMILRPENGEQAQKPHETGVSNLPDSQAAQTHVPTVNNSSSKNNLLEPDSNAILVDNFQKAAVCETLPDDPSLPQVGSSDHGCPTVISSHQGGDVPKVASPVAKDLASELDASLDVIKGSEHEVVPDSGIIHAENEVVETQNPPKDDNIIDQTENNDRNKRVNNDKELIDTHPSEKRSGDLQLKENTKENLKVATKKHQKRKEKDVAANLVENPSEDGKSSANLAKSSITNHQTDEPDKLSSLNAGHMTHKSIETFAGVDADSHASVDASENDGGKIKKKGKRKEKDVEPAELPLKDVKASAALAEGSISIRQSDGPEKLLSLNASCETQKFTETVAGAAAESLVGTADASETDGGKGKKRRKRKAKDATEEPVENPSKDFGTGAAQAESSRSIIQTDEPDKFSSLNAPCETGKFTETVAGVAAESLVGSADASETDGGKGKKRRKRKEKDITEEPIENPSKDIRTGAAYAESSKNIIQTGEPDKLSSLNAFHEILDSIDSVAGNTVKSLAGRVDSSEINGSKVETKGDETSAQAVALANKKEKRPRKRCAVRLRSSNLAVVEEHEEDLAHIASLEHENAITGNAHVGIHEHAKTGNENNALPVIEELKTMESEAKNCEERADPAAEGTGMVDFEGKKIKMPKKSKATSAKSHASNSGVEYINDTGELPSLNSNLHGLDDNHDKNHISGYHGFDEPKEVENSSCLPSKRDTLKVSQADNAKGNELCPAKLDPISKTENIVDFKDEKVKRKSKKSRSNAKSILEPSMELQDSVHRSSGDGQNLDIYQTDENKKEGEAFLGISGDKKEDNVSPRKRNKPKSKKTSSRNQLAGSMLEGEDNGSKSKSSQLDNISNFEASVDGSQGETNDGSQGEVFVPRVGDSGNTAKELATSRKPPRRTSMRDKKSKVEDTFLPLKKSQENTPDTTEIQVSASKDGDNHTHHCDNGTSVINNADMNSQPTHQHHNSVGGPNESKATRSRVGDVFLNGSSVHSSAIPSSSKVNAKASEKRRNAGEAASTDTTDSLDKTIYISKQGTKRQKQSKQYYISVHRAPDRKAGEVSDNPDREKNFFSAPDSIFEHLSGNSSEDEGGENDSEATTDIPTDNSSSSSYSGGEEKRSSLKTPSSRRTHTDSQRSGRVPPVAHEGKNKENDGNDIVLSQSIDNGANSRSIGMLLRKTSSYRKAKITASQSRLEDSESQPVDFVPDSQAAHDFNELYLSQ